MFSIVNVPKTSVPDLWLEFMRKFWKTDPRHRWPIHISTIAGPIRNQLIELKEAKIFQAEAERYGWDVTVDTNSFKVDLQSPASIIINGYFERN